MDFASQAASLELMAGLFDLGWRWARPAAGNLQSVFEKELIWWWRGRQGLLALWEDDEEPGYMHIFTVLCPLEKLTEMLLDYRRLMAQTGRAKAGWGSPADLQVQTALNQAGFARSWDKSLYIYELKK
jgi:hypothetical protein